VSGSRRRGDAIHPTVAADRGAASIPARVRVERTVPDMTGKPHLLLVGAEPLRRHLRPEGAHLLVDAVEDDPVAGVRGAGLFTTSVRVTRVEALDVAASERLVAALRNSTLPVHLEAEKLNVAVEKRLAAVCEVSKLSLESRGKETVARIAEQLGLRLEGDVVGALLERLGHDPGRLVGTLEALAAGGFREPTSAQVRLLAGSSRAEGLPWSLLDDIERGEVTPDLLERLEAIPTIAFLAKRVRLATYSVENPDREHGEVHESFGNVSESAWRQARRLGTNLGVTRCRALLETLAAAEVHAKRGRGDAALALAGGSLRVAMLDAKRARGPRNADHAS